MYLWMSGWEREQKKLLKTSTAMENQYCMLLTATLCMKRSLTSVSLRDSSHRETLFLAPLTYCKIFHLVKADFYLFFCYMLLWQDQLQAKTLIVEVHLSVQIKRIYFGVRIITNHSQIKTEWGNGGKHSEKCIAYYSFAVIRFWIILLF